jgi:hypothetical protein
MPRGGRRPGAGRKPKTPLAKILALPSVPVSPTLPPAVEEFDAPDTLTREERVVWLHQAPFAFRMGTLTRATALAFERYCRMVVQETVEAKSSAVNGPGHRGLRRDINMLELQFVLTPCGKPMPDLQAAGGKSTASEAGGKLARFRNG